MKRETIDTLKALASTVRSMGTVESHRLDAAIEDLEQELLEPEGCIPAEGVIVEVSNSEEVWYMRESAGTQEENGNLVCYCDTGNVVLSYWRNWRPIPNITQWTDHDGLGNCPCDEDRPVHVVWDNGNFASYNRADDIAWELVGKYCIRDKK